MAVAEDIREIDEVQSEATAFKHCHNSTEISRLLKGEWNPIHFLLVHQRIQGTLIIFLKDNIDKQCKRGKVNISYICLLPSILLASMYISLSKYMAVELENTYTWHIVIILLTIGFSRMIPFF